MSVYESDTDPHSHVEWNPCIRKGKHKPKHKKQKKHEAKIQKTNLIRSKTYKLLNSEIAYFADDKKVFDNLVRILKTSSTAEWNEDCELLYTSIYHMDRVEEYQKLYDNLQTAKANEEYYALCATYEEYDDDYYDRYEEYKYWRRSRYSWC